MITEVSKINIIGQKKYFDKAIETLHALGNVEIRNTDDSDVETNAVKTNQNENLIKINYQIAQINFAIKFLDAHTQESKKTKEQKNKVPFIDKFIKPKISINQDELLDLVKNYNWKNTVLKCEETESKMNNGLNQIKMLEEKINELKKWDDIKLSHKDFEETQNTKTILTEIPKNKFKKINIFKNFKLSAHKILKSTNKNILTVITYNKKIEKSFLEHLNELKIESIEIPEFKQSPEQEILSLKNNILKENNNIKSINRDIKELLEEEKKLKILYDWSIWQKDKITTSLKSLKTKYTFCATAWTSENNIKNIENELEKISQKISVIKAKITENSNEIPIILKNKKLAEPFEFVTKMYGDPLYNEPDPSPFLAPFFILFFALALTDAMYGIILAVLAFGAIKLFKIPKENQKLFKIILYGGIVTFIIGALFGGWFGIALEELPAVIGTPLMKLRIINPIVEPVKFLILTFILGIIQVLTGLTLSMYWDIKQGKILEGIMDKGFWIILIVSLPLWGVTAAMPIGNLFKLLAIISALLLVLTQGRDAKNIIVRLLKGILSLYDITGYFSDILSYSRLLALGLATGIIAMVINIIAGISMEMIPFVGWLIAILILVGGHIFNIAINVLGAYIHSSRLQYVEFFPKFMEGGGRAFQPFRKECKYVKVVE